MTTSINDNGFNEKNKIFDYIKDNQFMIVINFVFILLSHGVLIFYYKMGVDSEFSSITYDKVFNGSAWIEQGRFGIALIKYIFNTGIISIPIFNYILSFICINLSLIIFNYIMDEYNLKKNNFIKKLFFNILFITSTQLPTWLTFTMYAFEVSMGYLFIGIAILYTLKCDFSDKKRVKYTIVTSIFFLVLGIAIYQSFILLYGGIVLFILILRDGEKKNSDDLKLIYLSMSILISSVIMYVIINKLLSGSFIAKEGGYVSGFIGWGKGNLNIIFSNIKLNIYNILAAKTLYGGEILGLIYLMAILIMIYYILKPGCFKKAIYLFTLAISPFGLSFILLSVQPIRSMVSLPFVCGAIGYILLNELLSRLNINIWGIIAVLIIGINISVYPAKLNYGDFIRYNQDVNLANNIAYKLDKLNLGEYPDYPIVFIGHNTSNNDVYVIKTEVIGNSIFEWDMGNIYRQISFMKTLGYRYKTPTKEEIKIGYEISKNMPIFPSDGSIIFKNNIIVIKLSEPHDYWKLIYDVK